jgi:3D-(3,5/4)-trihydroxycyclohexane-1,2-dione acylhydrolase (decyclizing)
MRLTVAQALIRFLSVQYSERDGVEQRLVGGCFGIFGHGNVAGVGQALLEETEAMPFYHARNEQGMVHAAIGYARMKNRLSTLACTSSIGPGATNMVTGAALATINRLPVLLLPGDVFATRAPGTVLQELEDPTTHSISVNDTLRPVSRYWDRVERPEQLAPALLSAMRVLTDPAETGAVTLCLPQDVQAEAREWPEELFDKRVWRVRRPLPEAEVLAEAAALLRDARNPLIVSGGGTIYAEATDALAAFAEATGIPVAETQAGKGSLLYDHPQSAGAIGATGTTDANAIAREADVVLGIGTRWSDFTTASRSIFANDDVRFINLNVAPIDSTKHAGLPLLADARVGLEALTGALEGSSWTTPEFHWGEVVERAYTLGHTPLPAQSEVIGVVNRVSGPRDVVVCAAGSMPGDLHKLWRTRDPKGYHVEYGYSTMGYEIAGGLGVKMAAPDREVFVLVGDGSYLMMAQELVTAVAEGIKLTVVLVQNHGYASIGALSESLGSQRFGTAYRYRNPQTGALDGERLPVDLAANAASLGARAIDTTSIDDFETALRKAAGSDLTTVVQVHTDPLVPGPDSEAWWDVPVAEVAALDTTRAARAGYEAAKRTQKTFLKTPETVRTP